MNYLNETPARVYGSIKRAEAIAKDLNSGDGDDDIEFRVIPHPDGKDTAIIKVYDEDGEFISNWS